MIDEQTEPYDTSAIEPLPDCVVVTKSFQSRLPSQRVMDRITEITGHTVGELADSAPFRLTAFRALMRDFPHRDLASMWAHAYDVEVEVADALDLGNGKSTMPAPISSGTGD
jgi:hypothetical protein